VTDDASRHVEAGQRALCRRPCSRAWRYALPRVIALFVVRRSKAADTYGRLLIKAPYGGEI
jgi:hypothetical protein